MVGILFAAGAVWAQVTDSDSDLVPDAFDNCLVAANGPGEPSNQIDSDTDGYGDVCERDLDDDFFVNENDLAEIVTNFGETVPPGAGEAELTGDLIVGMPDVLVWRRFIQTQPEPGPSGLACAGIIPCTP